MVLYEANSLWLTCEGSKCFTEHIIHEPVLCVLRCEMSVMVTTVFQVVKRGFASYLVSSQMWKLKLNHSYFYNNRVLWVFFPPIGEKLGYVIIVIIGWTR